MAQLRNTNLHTLQRTRDAIHLLRWKALAFWKAHRVLATAGAAGTTLTLSPSLQERELCTARPGDTFLQELMNPANSSRHDPFDPESRQTNALTC